MKKKEQRNEKTWVPRTEGLPSVTIISWASNSPSICERDGDSVTIRTSHRWGLVVRRHRPLGCGRRYPDGTAVPFVGLEGRDGVTDSIVTIAHDSGLLIIPRFDQDLNDAVED